MNDLAERMRRGEPCVEGCGAPCKVMDEASGCVCAMTAARIWKLEAALREIDTACSNPGSWSPVVMERIIERVQELSRAAMEKST